MPPTPRAAARPLRLLVLAAALTVVTIAATLLPVGAAQATLPRSLDWIGGKDLYATSALMSQQLGGASTVYLTSGESGGDALAVPPAAAAADAHVLMVRRDSVPSVVAAELRRLNPRTVNVVGSRSVLSDRLWAGVRAILPRATIRRVGTNSGDRVDSALALARDLQRANGQMGPVAFIIGQNGYSDGLATGNVAARLGAPLIPAMGTPSRWAQRVAPVLQEAGQVFFIGSRSVLPEAYMDALYQLIPGDVERIYGSDRYRTNAAVVDRFVYGVGADRVFLIAGNGHGDTIGASVLATELDSIMMLSGRTCHAHGAIAQQVDRLDVRRITGIGTKHWITSDALRFRLCGGGSYAGTTPRFAPGTVMGQPLANATSFTREQQWAGQRYGTFRGIRASGQAGSTLIALPAGARSGVVTLTHAGTDVSVESLDAGLGPHDWPLLDYGDRTRGATGVFLSEFRTDPAPRYLRVEADGAWSLTVRDLRHTPMLRWSGTEDAVGLWGGRDAWARTTVLGDSLSIQQVSFYYWRDYEVLQGSGGQSVTGAIDAGPSLIVIDSDGTGDDSWRLQVTAR
ncbi:cell wall-binding repeat-containing protein [Agrococcus carbonis]|uniref:Putative cell wall binding repeat 2 n=1 Tax=Agrococcus carbonis TaxID=684552 RepID=A0A1H1PVD0_9MICO|nr:cell wall-binding repeat-containing protein [Agrococcus carbonis]SDS15125.1 Putative cell wall binding repeat 2 [Agrococcus carbonis]